MSPSLARSALCALAALTPFATSTSLNAQDPNLQREIEFVRALAEELRFIPLAQEQVERLKSANPDGDAFKAIYQLGIDVTLTGARSNSDREVQRRLFKEALDQSAEFIDRYEGESIADQARVSFVRASFDFGSFLVEEIELARTENPARVPELEELARETYGRAVDGAKKAKESLSDYQRGTRKEFDFFVTWLYQGMLQRELARVSPESEQGDRADVADITFEEFIFEMGEATVLGQRGFFEMAKTNEIRKDFDAAVSAYFDTVAIIKDTLDDPELQLSAGLQGDMLTLLQEAYGQAAKVRLENGDPAAAIEIAGQFREDLKTYYENGENVLEASSPIHGHRLLLIEARALAAGGQPSQIQQALAQAQTINDLHGSDFVGLTAKAALSAIIAEQKDVPGEILFEIAKGELAGSDDKEPGLRAMKRAYAAMNDEEKRQFGLELHQLTSRGFAQQDRFLEASLVAIRGLERHGNDASPNASAETLAELLDSTIRAYVQATKGTAEGTVAQLRSRSDALLKEFGGTKSVAQAQWRRGEALRSERKYNEAAQAFAQITSDTPYFDRAQARIVLCYAAGENYASARQTAASYRQFLTTPDAEIPEDRTDLQQYRAVSVATVGYYDCRMDYLESIGAVGGSADSSRFEPTIRKIEQFLSEFGEIGRDYVSPATDMMARLYAKSGDLPKAEELYRGLRTRDPNSSLVPALATQIFSSHYKRVQRLEKEVETLETSGAPEEEAKKASESLTEARKAALSSGLEYVGSATKPIWGVYRTTLSVAESLAKSVSEVDAQQRYWKTSEELARGLVDAYGEDSQHGESVQKWVTPVLGESLLRQRRFAEASAFLETAAEVNPDNFPLKRLLNLAQGGFYEFDRDGNFVEIAGADQPNQAWDRHYKEYKVWAISEQRGVQPYDIEWYEFQLECLMFATRAAGDDKAYLDRADQHLRIAKSIDNLDLLRTERGDRGRQLFQLFVRTEQELNKKR